MATLTEILDAREVRVQRQQALLAQFGKSLICFTMNIPGPEKDSPLIRAGFRLGEDLLTAQLAGSGIPILYAKTYFEVTGPVGFYVAEADPLALKALACQAEDSSPAARLFDMDILTPEGKISREALGLSPRKCLICHRDAWVCSRSRAHPVEDLQKTAQRLLRQAVNAHAAKAIAAKAVQSLLWEVCTTPKPGLVDCQNSGSHGDMDIFTFTASAAALQPYFEVCARMGMDTRHLPPEDTFQKLRLPGKEAEQTMYRVTGGVNTHKGAIFSLGILCAAAGRTDAREPEVLLAECAAMTRGICARELGQSHSNGQTLYAEHGLRGVRGQAEDGFPAVKKGLEILEEGLRRGYSLNDSGCAALLHMLLVTEDTNLLWRSDGQTCKTVLGEVRSLLEQTPYPGKEALNSLDKGFIRKNLSPGGSADLLTLCYFLHLYNKN